MFFWLLMFTTFCSAWLYLNCTATYLTCVYNRYSINEIQWGSEIRPFEIWKHLKSGLFEGQISNGPVFKWSCFSYGYSYNPNHLNTRPFKCFVRISNGFWQKGGHLSGSMLPDLKSIQSPDHLQPKLFLAIWKGLSKKETCLPGIEAARPHGRN